ncbi:MAG TPA: hypothetical protein DCO83_18615, partial [Mucilaginibacter sp.]|nr:hypothetical protein [Mucilaginibacter sp.]
LNVLTIATGKKLYIDMAVNLARSFWLWNAESDINFYLATDQPQSLPDDVKTFVKIIQIKPGALGEGFSTKLHLDKLAPSGQTLFIDSDCLIYGNIEGVFGRFAGHSVSVIGGYISTGEWFGNVKAICKKFNITQIPKFNGGIYYLENGEKAGNVYRLARQLEKQYDEIGFVRLRNRPNDEVIIALAMALNNEEPIPDDGSIMSDPLSCPGNFSTNVIKGKTSLLNPPKPSPLHQDWYPFEKVKPLIIHFLGHHSLSYQYKKDAYCLQAIQSNKLSFGKRIFASVVVELPMRTKILLKQLFRPVYKLMFGTRAIKQSERL